MENIEGNPFTEELKKESRAAEREDKELLEACAALVKMPAFERYCEALDSMVTRRGSMLLEPLQGENAALRQEFEKGTIKGLLLARGLPHVTIAMMANESLAKDDGE